MTSLSLAEALALLALSEDGILRGPQEDLDLGLAAALLADLSTAGKIDHIDGNVVVTNSEPTGNTLDDAALRDIAQDARLRGPRDWVVRLTKNVRDRTLEKLVQDGELIRTRSRMLRLLPVDRYRVTSLGDSSPVIGARQRLRRAAIDAAAVDRTSLALCALVSALGWSSDLVPDLPAQDVDRRFAAMRRSVWAAGALRDLINERRVGPWGPTVGRIAANLDEWPTDAR
ncbi:GPP34 family phosphoprotein [Micromonospora sp. NPDC047707]|uniref:GOLPH3/VPS74 family protein n=1 Tax=unclassified Micromonospora TaxID=2617518 RepID=UPI0018AF80D6|nr:GPP34 family phosphoprotein [Micromonospora sp. WMMC415]